MEIWRSSGAGLGHNAQCPRLKQPQLVYPASTPGCNVSLLDATDQSTWHHRYLPGSVLPAAALRLNSRESDGTQTTLIKHRHDTPIARHIYDSSCVYRAGLHMPIEKNSLAHKSVEGLEPSSSWISRLFCGTNVVIPWRISSSLHAPTHVKNQGTAIQLGKLVS